MNKQDLFKTAYRAARQAVAGREIQAYQGESSAKAEASAVRDAAYAAAASMVYLNGEGYAAVMAAVKAAMRALVARRSTGETLAERLDIFRRERAGEYIYD